MFISSFDETKEILKSYSKTMTQNLIILFCLFFVLNLESLLKIPIADAVKLQPFLISGIWLLLFIHKPPEITYLK